MTDGEVAEGEEWVGRSMDGQFPVRPIRRRLYDGAGKEELARDVALRIAHRVYGRCGTVGLLCLHAFDLDTGCEIYRASVRRYSRVGLSLAGEAFVAVRPYEARKPYIRNAGAR